MFRRCFVVPAGRSRVLALVVMLAACGEDGVKDPVDTFEVTPDTAPDITPDTAPEVEADTEPDVALDTAPEVEVDTTPPPPVDPFEAVDPTPSFLPEEEAPPVALSCPRLVNAGAEAGDLTGWQVAEGTFEAADNFPIPYAGGWQFRAGRSSRSRLTQAYHLGSVVAEPRTVVLRTMVRSDDSADEAWMAVAALDDRGIELAARRNGPYTSSDWREGEVALALPAGTTQLRITLEGVRLKGTDNDAYFDDVEVCLYDRTPQALTSEIPGPPFLMNVTPNAVTVIFETRLATTAVVEYGLDPSALDKVATSPVAKQIHKVRLTGLEPFTRYYYRVRYADLTLPPYDFLTARAPDDDGRIEFIMFADNQDGPNVFRGLAKQMAAWDPDFILHGGDVVQNGTPWDYRETFFGPYFGLGNHAAIVMGPGNHETYSSTILTSDVARALWDTYVDQPGDKHCFGWRWGSLFVMVIDTERPHGIGTAQYGCIEQTLGSELAQSATFRVALFHRAPLIEYWSSIAGEPSDVTFFTFGMDAPDVRTYLAPLFQRMRVQLVMNGHNHLYQFIPRWPEFTAWVISGGGGGGLETGDPSTRVNDWSAFVEKQTFGRFHYLRGIIEDGRLWVRAIGDRGDVIHAFEIDP
jgi:hypothetical protein